MKHAGSLTSLLLCAVIGHVMSGQAADLPVGKDPISLAGKRDFVKMLPHSSSGVLVIKDWGKLVTIDDRSPIGKLINNECFQQSDFGLLAKLLPKPGDIEKATGLDSEAVLRLFRGQAVISANLIPNSEVTELDKTNKQTDPDGDNGATFKDKSKDRDTHKLTLRPDIEGLAFIEFNGTPAEYEKLLRGFKQLAEDRGALLDFANEPFEGTLMTTITTKDENIEKEQTYYSTLLDGVIVIARKKEPLQDGIKALRSEIITDNFAATPAFLKATAEMGDNDGYAILNLDGMSSTLRKFVEESIREMLEAKPMGKMFFDPVTVAKELNFESLTVLYGSFRLEEKQIAMNWGLTWKEKVGIASLMQYGPLPVTLPDFVTTEFKAASVSSVDLSRTWDAVRTLAQKITPQGWMMMTNTMAMSKPEIFKSLEQIREDLLLNLEPEIISLQGFPDRHPSDDMKPGMIFLFKLKRADSVLKAIDAIRSMIKEQMPIPDPDERTYLGTTIFTYKGLPLRFGVQVEVPEDEEDIDVDKIKKDAENGSDLSYAVVDDRLIIASGEAGFIETVIANMKTPGRTLVSTGVFDSISAISGRESDLDYVDIATMLRSTMNEIIPLQPKSDIEKLLKQRDTLKDLHYHYASKSFISETGFHTKALITEDKK